MATLGIVLALGPAVARAEPAVCHLDDAGNRTCGNPVSCITRATCISSPGTEDETCQVVGRTSGMTTGRECLHDCTTLFSCGSASDCPARVNALSPICSPVVNGTTPVASVCTYSTSSSTVAPSSQITYSVAPGNHVTTSQIAACHRRAGVPGELTDDYYRGDCDGDGCPNGHDTDPCQAPASGASCTPGTPVFESPFCAPLPAIACTFVDGDITCDDARPCNPSSASILPCPGAGVCEDGWSDVPRCRPPCSSLFLCAPGTGIGGLAPPEQCPMFGGSLGTCIPLPSPLSPIDGRAGVCVYPEFGDATCTATNLSAMCFHGATDGMLTSNFFAGDCDGDGAPNGCDDMICDGGGGTTDCRDVPGAGCAVTYVPPVDAGTPPDAGADDAGNVQVDAGSGVDAGSSGADAGNTQSDASAGIDGGVMASFSGGGGCRCAAAGAGTRPFAGTALLLLVLGWVMRRRTVR